MSPVFNEYDHSFMGVLLLNIVSGTILFFTTPILLYRALYIFEKLKRQKAFFTSTFAEFLLISRVNATDKNMFLLKK